MGRLNLQGLVTVFTVTVGEPSFDACQRALDAQDCDFDREVVSNVAPMSAAFQQMIDRCKTPLYVQVDADMILRPNAIFTLYTEMWLQQFIPWMVCRSLWDDHIPDLGNGFGGYPIVGVKIYRRSVTKQFPYTDSLSCEMDQVKRIEAAGYRADVEWVGEAATRDDIRVLGEHAPLAYTTGRMAYERFYSLFAKYRRFPWIKWLGSVPQRLLARFQEHGHPLDFYALAGIMHAFHPSSENDSYLSGEKDFTAYDRLSGYNLVAQHMKVVQGGHAKAGPETLVAWMQVPEHPYEVVDEWIRRAVEKWPTLKRVRFINFNDSPHLAGAVRTAEAEGLVVDLATLPIHGGSCREPWMSVAMDGAGAMSVCEHIKPAQENGTFGDVDFWNSAWVRSIRAGITGGGDMHPQCVGCPNNRSVE